MDEEEIKKRAYELFLKRDRQHGLDQEDWFTAKTVQEATQRRRETTCDLIFLALLIIAVVITIYFCVIGFLLWAIFGFSLIAVYLFTFYVHFRRKIPDWFRALNASFNTFLKLIPAFTFSVAAFTFILNYQPFFSITNVENQPNYQEVPTGNSIKLPETGIFFIKNDSKVWTRKGRVRYSFVSSEEGGEKNTCYLDQSRSEENFPFGPDQQRGFLFSFGNAANKSNQDFDHLFLLIHFEYTPPLEIFTKKDLWEVYHYDPIKKLWVVMRKNHPPRKDDFEEWKRALITGSDNIVRCLPPQTKPLPLEAK